MRRPLIHSLVLLLFCTIACQRSAPTAAPAASAPAAAPKILRVHLASEPEFVDPNKIAETEGSTVMLNVFEGLVRYDPRNNTPLPGLADRWEISPDGRVYTFHLRPSIVWSDGTPITADDALFAWERVLNPATAAKYVHGLYPVKNAKAYSTGALTDFAQVGLKTRGADLFEVTLEHATPYFLQLIRYPAFAPTPRHIVAAHGDRWIDAAHIVGSGPFLLTAHEPHARFRLAKNPRYWDAASVKLDGVDFVIVEDLETAFKMYESGALDFVRIIADARLPTLAGRPDFILEPTLSSYHYWLNTQKPPFDNPRVRQAFALAIDRDQLCTSVLKRTKVPKSRFVPAGMPDYPDVSGPAFDPAKARALLAAAGYADLATFPKVALQYNTDERHRTVAQVVQQMWKQNLGIAVDLVNVEWKTHLTMLRQHDFQIGRVGWNADYADPNAFLEIALSTSEQNFGAWHDAEFDQIMTHASSQQGAERLATLARAEARVVDAVPILSLYQNAVGHLIRPTVKGIYETAEDRHPLWGVWME